jgi:ATP-dependent helicase/nuclease subunit B
MSNDPLLKQLAELCRAEPTRAKWVFVPSHSVGLTLGDRLAREGCDWANLRLVTPLDVAIRMAAPFLLERGIDPSGEQLGPALMMRLMLALPEGQGYFRPMAEHTSMAEALWRTIRELRYAGVRAADLEGMQFTAHADKRREVVALLSAYECHLEAMKVADMPVVLQEASTHADWCPIAAGDLVTELPDAIWSPRVRQFLDGLPGRRIAPRAPVLPGVPLPARAVKLAPAVERLDLDAPTDASRLRFLQSAGTSGAAKGDGTLDIFHAGGRDAEVDEVFRRILAGACPLDQVEIACASDVYQLLVREKALRFGWKVTLSAGVPAATTRPGRLVLGYCDWIAGDFAAADLRRLLQSGNCGAEIGTAKALPYRTTGADGDIDLSPGQAARLLLKAQATSGRATYKSALTRLAEKYERRAQDEELSDEERGWNTRKETQTRALLEWVASGLATVPTGAEPGGQAGTSAAVSLMSVVEGAAAFLERNAARANAVDAIAYVALTDALRDLSALGDYQCDLPVALRFLRERVASLSVGRERPRPGHLHVSSLADAGYDGRRHVYVVGLQEGGVFPAVVEDPVLLDDERCAISALLATSPDRQDEAVFRALSRMAAIGASAERVCLSFSCFDTREFRQTFPCWIVLQALRLRNGDASLSYEDLAAWLGDPTSAVPRDAKEAISEADWWLANRAAPDAILSAYPALADGIHADKERASDRFTNFDGHVAIAGAVLDPTRSERPVSATTLESAAKCPLRFFMEQGLGVRVIEEGRVDEDAWLDPATKGSELHALFARIVRAVRDEKRKPDVEKDGPRLSRWGQQRLAELREEMPPPSEEVFARESREFLDDLNAFIEAECEGRHGADPVGLEVAFGFPEEEGEGERLASPDPVAIDLGNKRRLLLHGRIDRINRIAPGQYEVADYKTGGYWPDDWEGDFAGGTHLQHALYGIAATSLLKPGDPKARVVRGLYIFPAMKGHRRKKSIPAPSKVKLDDVLADLADVIANGAFLPADGEQACKWCQFKAACHAEDVARAQSKRDNPANRMLEPYRRLRQHE